MKHTEIPNIRFFIIASEVYIFMVKNGFVPCRSNPSAYGAILVLHRIQRFLAMIIMKKTPAADPCRANVSK
jgi:hypothetical protein